MNPNLPSNPTPETARPWLQAHYQARRQRTVNLVKATIDRLKEEGLDVTIEAICRVSKDIDPEGKGIKKAGVLGNAEAHRYYQQQSPSYQRYRKRRRQPSPQSQLLGAQSPIEPDRDVGRVRRRYLQLPKATLVERLLSMEQEYATLQEQLVRLQFALVDVQQERKKALEQRGQE